MKKFIVMCILALGLVAFNACDSENNSRPSVWPKPPIEIIPPVEPTPPVVEPTPPIDPPVEPTPPVDPIEPIPPVVDRCDLPAPSIGDAKEFISFDTNLSMPYLPSDYEAIAAQEVIFKCDYRSYEGKVYKALQDHSTYPNGINEDGNPFFVISDKAYVGGYYFRTKPNEPDCTEKVTFTSMPEINDMNVWKVDWYGTSISQYTESCDGYGILDPYIRNGQIGTDTYGSITLGGWKFVHDERLIVGYSRDYEIIPTPDSEEDLDFWELVEND